jgi:hypothetical protein
MQRERQLNHAQIRRKVRGSKTEQVAQRLANFVGDLIKLIQRHLVKLEW